MPDETTVPQTAGASKAKRPQPVNLAIIEAKERGLEPEPAKPAKPAKAESPEPVAQAEPVPVPITEPVPEPVAEPAAAGATEVRSLAELAEAGSKGTLSKAAEDRARSEVRRVGKECW